jgi:hypothetical protein
MRVLKTFAFLAIAKLISGCGLADISSGEFKDQKSNWILPIVNSQISVESISQLADLNFEREVAIADIPFELQVAPGLQIPKYDTTRKFEIGPLSLEEDSNYYVKAKSDTAVLRAIIYNNFPFDLGVGTIIEIYNRNKFDGETTPKMIYRKKLTKAIKAKGVDSLEIKENSLLGWIDNDFDIYLKNFSTPGASSNSGFDKPMKIVFKLIVLKINTVELVQGKKYNLEDESELRLDEGGDLGVDFAKYNLFIRNGFPATYNLQAYFLDSLKQKVDSLIKGDTKILSPDIDWKEKASTVITSSVKERTFSTDWSEARYVTLKRTVRYLKTEASFQTSSKSGNNSVINLIHDNKIGVTLTGKFTVNYDLNKD